MAVFIVARLSTENQEGGCTMQELERIKVVAQTIYSRNRAYNRLFCVLDALEAIEAATGVYHYLTADQLKGIGSGLR